MKKTKVSVSFYPKKDRVKNNGEYPMYFYIFFDKRKKQYPMGFDIEADAWDMKSKEFCKRGYQKEKLKIEKVQERLNSITQKLLRENRLTFDNIIEAYENREVISLFEFMRKDIRVRENSGKLKNNTIRGFKAKLNVLEKGFKDIPLKAIDYNYIKELETFLRTERGLSDNSIHTYHKIIINFLHKAKRQDLLDEHPYIKHEYKTKCPAPAERIFLTKEELKKLHDLFRSETLEPYRQNALYFFLIASYTGMRYSEWINVKDQPQGENDEFVIRQMKTNQTIKIPINKPIKELLAANCDEYHIISDQKARSYLKSIMHIVGIEKHVTTHTARHTFAMICLNDLGFEMGLVSKLLGHSSIRTTEQFYAKYLNETAKKAMKKWDNL